MKTKQCPDCKKEVPENSKYCSNCGHKFLKRLAVNIDDVISKPVKRLSEIPGALSKPFNQKTTDEKLNTLNIKLDMLIKLLKPKK